MADSESRDPVSQLQAAAARACCGAGMRWRTLVDSANQHRQAVQGSAVQLWGNLAHAVEERLKAHERMPMPALADIKSRLAGVPVYTVANKKNEFVLVSGEGENDTKQLGLFFFAEPDAEAMVEKIREQNPKLAKQTRVLKVTVDKVYDFAITPDGAGVPGANGASVIFRFMPDAKEVQSALELYREAGIAVGGFAGVPVFQAEGLTVKTERARYTPLFLAREDLDAAVGNAYNQRGGEREAGASAGVAAAAQEDQRAQQALAAAEGKDRSAREADAAAAADKLAKAEGRLRALRAEGLPKVEVGSLEEVIGKMQADASGEWASVMFIPAGALAAPP